MIRFFLTLLVGAVLGFAGRSFFSDLLPHSPAAVQKAAASLGIKERPPVAPANYVLSGPLSASVQAETNKKYDEALKEVAAFQQARGDAFVASERAGWLYYLKGAYPDAERAYTNANRIHSAALNPVIGLLNVAEAMKDANRVRSAAEAVVRLDPSNYRANMALAGNCFAAKDYRGASFSYRRILTSYPDDVDARSGVAWAAFYLGDKQEAFSQFQTILNIYPDYPYAKQGYKLTGAANGNALSAH